MHRSAPVRDAAVGLLSLTLAATFAAWLRPAAALEPVPETAQSALSPEHPPRVASYTLSARLDADAHEISASGTLVFQNRSTAPLSELYFHLYLNAFKNEKSVFLRSPFGEGRGGARAGDWGYIDVRRLVARELGGADLWPARTPGTPSEPDDETDVRVPLPEPLFPGKTLTLDLEWKAKLPAIVLRTGYERDFHLVGQWFPKIARLEPDGRFAHFPFHPQAEFAADFGDYEVTLDVPSVAVVGATGERVESQTRGSRRTERYRASAVHDFAWTAWPRFLERKASIDGVAVRVLYPAGHEANAEATIRTLAVAMPSASRRYGRYPYPTLTVVHPPERAAGAGGMEYPTLITTGGPWYLGLFGDRALESVTIHELLHQWFYGLVASDETRAPFLDEGLTSFAEVLVLESEFGRGSAFRGFGLELSATALARTFSATRAEDVPVSSPAAAFPGFQSLAALVYSRTATLLATLGRVYGEDRLERALTRYATRLRFSHPRPEEFLGFVREELGAGAARALELGLNERGRVDYLVRDLENARERTPAGVFDGQNGRETVPANGSTDPLWRGRATVFRHGNLEFPVDIELVGSDGSRRRERWDGRDAFHVVEWRGATPLAHVIVDPDRRVLVDGDLLNNAIALAPHVPRRTLERTLYFSEVLFALFGP